MLDCFAFSIMIGVLLLLFSKKRQARKIATISRMYLGILLIILLCFFRSGFQQPVNFNVSRVCIVTVIDPSHPPIVRDALTLLRSMRLSGGTMNEATFHVYIPLDAGHALIDEEELLNELELLRVEMSFIKQTKVPTPRTLNKFRAWEKFDYENFDYLLWLDADFFVVADPIPLIASLLTDSTTLMCAPEIYGYMRR